MAKKPESKYGDRNIYNLRWKYCLVVTEDDYYHECRQLGIKRDEWGTPTDGNAACCTFFMPPISDEQVVIVAILNHHERTGIEIAGLLVHEAMHIIQREFKDIGEFRPSDEFQAYSVQWVAQELMRLFHEQIVAKMDPQALPVDSWPFGLQRGTASEGE